MEEVKIYLPVSEEAPVDLIVNNHKVITFMCTPRHLKELAVGFLYERGIISGLDDIFLLGACDDMRKINVKIAKELPNEMLNLEEVLTSGCGSAGGFLDKEKLESQVIDSDCSISQHEFASLFTEIFKSAELYHQTGGVHCAGIISNNEVLSVTEDVGRHNSIDKVIGSSLFAGIELKKSVIVTTGRLSSDMVLKAIGAQIPIVASRSIPTSLAFDMAEQVGITLVGRINKGKPYIYTHGYRIE